MLIVSIENRLVFAAIKKALKEEYCNREKNSILFLGYNLLSFDIFKYRKLYPNKKFIIYQLEQVFNSTSNWYKKNTNRPLFKRRTLHITNCLRECDEIWDYDLDNIEFLKKEGFKNIIYKPLKYAESLKNISKNTDYEYDILFYGSLNFERVRILNILNSLYKVCVISNTKETNYRGIIAPPVYEENLGSYINNSKIIINLHYYTGKIQEQVRIFELLINNKIVVSEKSRRNYFGDLIYEFENEKEMIQQIDNILENKLYLTTNVSKEFKARSNMKDFKIGVAYHSFYGLELIEKSINSIKSIVDYIVIIHQTKGFSGISEPSNNKEILERLLDNKLVDEIVYYEINSNITNKEGVLEKRNLGLEYCKKNNCDYIIPLDTDELYDADSLLKDIVDMKANNIDTLYSPIQSYYYDENHYFKDTYFVPTVYKIDDRIFERTKTSILVDPFRKMKENTYKISRNPMHHLTFLVDSYSDKILNAIRGLNNLETLNNMKTIYKHLLSWKDGNKGLVFENEVKTGKVILSFKNIYKKDCEPENSLQEQLKIEKINLAKIKFANEFSKYQKKVFTEVVFNTDYGLNKKGDIKNVKAWLANSLIRRGVISIVK